MSETETIVALSSGALPAGIAVVRASGPAALDLAKKVAGVASGDRRARLRIFRDPDTGEEIDRGILLSFSGPDTVTGEDLAEFHCHGGPAVVKALLRILVARPGVRLAEAGEFTRRGFLNGKLDLAAVEGLGDLIVAETESQRRQAVRQAGGFLSGRVDAWRARLVAALAAIESGLDFADEDDVPDDVETGALADIGALADEIGMELVDGERGERLRTGLEVAIVGPPNAGKSSLLNALARREVAIVTPIAGTTRDVLEVDLDLNGYPVRLLDTAGLRDSDDVVEIEGIRRARQRASGADVVLALYPPSEAGVSHETFSGHDCVLKVGTKSDLGSGSSADGVDLRISVVTSHGLDDLFARLGRIAEDRLSGGEQALVTRERHRHALMEAERELWATLAEELPSEARAEHLRRAAFAFGRLTGRIDAEEVLGAVFSSFCIGK
ncbi:tRNA uridine-5-carboxymethylaminomethyl(34) synthesis GTPase MnmE [Amorphus sp. 3PC139-8]|uniref:tRNA uridine-5-carboxymethylaminomethyl(34) synthesis GTPase MnmE n=1 Tax=Amorphus sp. 3PC139-8 TaxID=2735676 RepID=UPI00345D29EC